MNALDLFLREHAALHSPAVADAGFRLDWMLTDLSDDDWRRRPRGLHSLAWLYWHVAFVEDTCLAPAVFGVAPRIDAARLNLDPGEAYTGSGGVDALSERVDLAALRAYRDEVGKQTREQARALWPDRWTEPLTADDLVRGKAEGSLDDGDAHLVGIPRESLLCWWGVTHTAYHVGQMGLVRAALGEER